MLRITLCLFAILAVETAAAVEVHVQYLRQEIDAPPTLSNLDEEPDDLGLAGARVGLNDNRTTGSFLGQTYELGVTSLPPGSDITEAANEALAKSRFLIIDAPAGDLLAVADLPAAEGALIFNIAAPEARLRDADCRGNVFHTLPSTSMRTDALIQFLVRKRWDDLALIAGMHPKDTEYAAALKRSATKFGLEMSAERTWAYDADMRRNAAQEVPLLTQELGDHDVLLIADEIGDFGRYVLYNTWEPRPVAGSEGLTAVTWSPVVEQWGAAQMQQRFETSAGRSMRSKDYAAWAAIRTIGEAVTRTGSGEAARLRDYILSEKFELAGFKGRPMTYRSWNGQLRQPIPIVHPRALAALAPLEGFMHQRTELDTLGLDRPESACRAFED
ncbi:ABC transporter substrate-binding protein [Roseibium sp. Sym1]|uniref:ABC transporter substrate-binding protein n=1 Tax=Roseibium sp. Sym1 TaxID=3016006 RepID=UPI0022B49D93|nr:ABC transporter substrate-binding protein [Roseibium sp. Sym1]